MRSFKNGLVPVVESLVFIMVLMGPIPFAQGASSDGLKLAVSQGISAPTLTSPVNFYRGFLPTNPSIAGTLKDASFTLEYATTKETSPNESTVGAELAVGSGRAGLVAAYLKESCDGCERRVAGMGGMNFDFVAVGLGYYEESTYTTGLLFNPKKRHRLGLSASVTQAQGGGTNTTAYGVGYSYNSDSVVFALDASKRSQGVAASDDIMLVTPGLQLKADGLALSVSHNIYMNDTASPTADNTWFGVGVELGPMYLAFYQNLVSDWSVATSFWF